MVMPPSLAVALGKTSSYLPIALLMWQLSVASVVTACLAADRCKASACADVHSGVKRVVLLVLLLICADCSPAPEHIPMILKMHGIRPTSWFDFHILRRLP